MKILPLLLMLASSAQATVNTSNYWPLDVGQVWSYENEEYPDRKTWIKLVGNEDGEVSAHFTKNHRDTYWSPGMELDLYWSLFKNENGTFSGNAANSDIYGVSNTQRRHPDMTTLYRDNYLNVGGEWERNVWYVRDPIANTEVDPYLLFPGTLPHTGETQMDTHIILITKDTHGQSNATGALWNLRYTFEYVNIVTSEGIVSYSGEVLRVKFDEQTNDHDGDNQGLHEDWYFAPNIGPVMIEQYTKYNRDEEEAYIRIKLTSVHAEPDMSIYPNLVERPSAAEGSQPISYAFELQGADANTDAGVVVTRAPRAREVEFDLAQIPGAGSWNGNTFNFNWTIDPNTPIGIYHYNMTDTNNQEHRSHIIVQEKQLQLEITPSVVQKPEWGSLPVTYQFKVIGGEPDKDVGIVGIFSPGTVKLNTYTQGNTPLDPLQTVDYWTDNTYVFPWNISASDKVGLYAYKVTSTDGRTAIGFIEVIE